MVLHNYINVITILLAALFEAAYVIDTLVHAGLSQCGESWSWNVKLSRVTMKKLTSLWLCFLTYKMRIMNCASELRLSWEPGRRGGPPTWSHSSLSLSSERELSVFYFCRSRRAELGVGHITVCGLIPSPLSGVTIYSSMAESTLPFLQQSHPHLRWPESFSARVQGFSRLWLPSEGWWRCWTHGDAFDFLGTLLALSNAKEELHLRSCLAFFLTH